MSDKSEQFRLQLEFFLNNHTEYEYQQLKNFARSLEKETLDTDATTC